MRSDQTLRETDLALKLFVEYCRVLDVFYERAVYISAELDNYGVSSVDLQTPIGIQPRKFPGDKNLILLMDREEKAWHEYNHRLIFVKSIARKLQDLDGDQLDLLYWRYERGWTLRQIGDKYFYSHMQVQRLLDDILETVAI